MKNKRVLIQGVIILLINLFTCVSVKASDGIIEGHEYVDLGLPSGIKWATCNVGASSPSDHGDYFAWGETRTKQKYQEENSRTYNKKVFDFSVNPDYLDAARANWGGSWRLPTKTECQELKDKCTWTWTTQGGHDGYKVTGPNGKSIFLPATGRQDGLMKESLGTIGYYWSSSPDGMLSAYSLAFNNNSQEIDFYRRWFGFTIRPVSDLSIGVKKAPDGIIKGHEYVDLALTSGTKWATCNIGASSPSDYGDYFAWGETTPKSTYAKANSNTFKKNIGDISSKKKYDAAKANWGESWRMPTKDEIIELIYECEWEWFTQDGHEGYKVTGPNGKFIFLPAAGRRYDSSLEQAGIQGNYWTSTPYKEDMEQSCICLITKLGSYSRHWHTLWRYAGGSIRPVSD